MKLQIELAYVSNGSIRPFYQIEAGYGDDKADRFIDTSGCDLIKAVTALVSLQDKINNMVDEFNSEVKRGCEGSSTLSQPTKRSEE